MSFLFNSNEAPEQAAKRRQSNMDMLQRGAMQPAQNVGQGLSSMAQALAWRAMDANKTPADPWAGMRAPGRPATPEEGGGGYRIPAGLMALFGR